MDQQMHQCSAHYDGFMDNMKNDMKKKSGRQEDGRAGGMSSPAWGGRN